MARRSTKENKTIYQRTREDLDLTQRASPPREPFVLSERRSHMNPYIGSGFGGLGGLLLIALGLIDLIVPKVSWYLGYGWRYKDAEPSDAALVFARMGGAIAIAIGIALLFLI